MTPASQTPAHQTLLFCSALSAIAGSIDAYTFLLHHEIFAGLQTGNFIQLGLQLGQGNFHEIGRFCLAIGAFLLGTLLVRITQHWPVFKKNPRRHACGVLTYEIVLLLSVLLGIPFLPSWAITSLLSLTAAAQLQEFRLFKGATFTSLMMTGNMRTLTEALYDGWIIGLTAARQKALDIGLILASFLAGAFTVGLCLPFLGAYTLVLSLLYSGAALAVLFQIPILFLRSPQKTEPEQETSL